MKIRRAESRDADSINALLYQVAKLHAEGRADIFKRATKKYTDEELLKIIACETSPIFVAVDEKDCVLGYAFCIYKVTENDLLLQDKRTLYIDDICVREGARGVRIGTRLCEYVEEFARAQGFDNVTLNVWAFNERAYGFYKKQGMTPQRIIMEKPLR